MKKILIVDDEPDILEILEYNLIKEGYLVQKASNGKEAIAIFNTFLPDIILLDVMMPELDGIETCRKIKESNIGNPYIVFLTARYEEFTEVAAWEAGGDDYIIKPIKPRALISRLNSVFKQKNTSETTSSNNNEISILDLKIDRSNYMINKGEESFSLPKKEFEILYLLAENPNKILNRDEILNTIWEEDTYVLSRTVDVHIRKIREKLGEGYIKTVKGVGYMFVK